MSGLKKGKIILIAAMAAFFAFLSVFSLISFSSDNGGERKKINFTGDELETNDLVLSMEDWEVFTYENAPEMAETVFDGEDAFYYELPTEPEEQYSMTAYVTSPLLNVCDRDYAVEVRYFTRQRESTPNLITVFTSQDGVEFKENSSFACMDSGSELENWRTAELSVSGDVKYIRFELTVYYIGTGAGKINNGGLYLSKSFVLSAVKAGSIDESLFEIEYERDDFYYNGNEQIPSYVVTANTNSVYYTYHTVILSGVEVSPVDAGDYLMKVYVCDSANVVITVFDKYFTIKKETIDYVESYETVSNANYVVLVDVVFVDSHGRRISKEESGCDDIYNASTDVSVTVKNDNFNDYSLRLGRIVSDAQAAYLFYIENKDIVTEYDGTEKGLPGFLTYFTSYDFNTGEFATISSASFPITYYLNGAEINYLPKDVGVYSYTIEYSAKIISGTITIKPRLISDLRYVGTGDLDKIYDGTRSVCVDGVIVDGLDKDDISSDDIVEGDEVFITVNKAEYARELCSTYIVSKQVVLSGEDAYNYTVAGENYVQSSARISPTTLYWTELKDENGVEVSFTEKIYNGRNDVEVANTKGDEGMSVAEVAALDVCLDMMGLGKGKVRFSDVNAVLDGVDCGDRKVIFTLTDASLFDKYNTEIITGRDAVVTIKPYEIKATAAGYTSGNTKVYDGNVDIYPEIALLNIDPSDMPIIDDGFEAAFNSEEYEVKYASASFDSPSAGDREITVSGVVICAYTRNDADIFANYKIKDMTLAGYISPKEIYLTTQEIRIYRGQALPDILLTEPVEEFINTSVHASYEDAENGVNALGNTTGISSIGTYYVRTVCTSSDYVLEGSYVIPLYITNAADRESQKIVTDLDTEVNGDIIVGIYPGGSVKLGARSISSGGRDTGLEVSVRRKSGICEIDGDVVRATNVNEFEIEVYCDGNSYYDPAESIFIKFIPVTERLSVSAYGSNRPRLYVGDELPDDDVLTQYLTVKLGSKQIDGILIAPEGTLTGEAVGYAYEFYPDDDYIASAIDYKIYGDRYELDGGVYSLTDDVNYSDSKTYYVIEAEEADGETGDDITGILYEADGESYVPTSDIVFAEGKTYYILTIEEDDKFLARSGYYVYDGNDYEAVAEGTRLLSSETYYRVGKVFYGDGSVDIDLAGTKRNVTVEIGGSFDVPYHTAFDLMKAVSSVNMGVPLTIDELSSFDGSVSLKKVSVSENSVVSYANADVASFEIGTYTVYSASELNGSYIMVADGGNEFDVTLTGSFTLRIVKSDLVVYARNYSKYYRSIKGSEDDLRSLLTIKGNYAPEDEEAILEGTTVKSAASGPAGVGEYGITVDGESVMEKYNVTYRQGYLTVEPTPVTVYATSRGHVYGGEVAGITVEARINAPASDFDNNEERIIVGMLRENVVSTVNVTSGSNVGSYIIDLEYLGEYDNFIVTFSRSVYVVSPARLTGITFENESVLYDGERHRLSVRYDEEVWQDLTITYNHDYFVNAGVYDFTATVSKENYETLVMEAKLTIGTLVLRSSSLGENSVSVKVPYSAYEDGLSPDVIPSLIYRDITDETSVEKLQSKIARAVDGKAYDLVSVCDILFTNGGMDYSMEDGVYEITFSPSSVNYSKNLQLLGYDENGNYEKLNYTYENGAYTIKVSKLTDLVFLVEKEETVNYKFIWVASAVVVVVIILVIAVVVSGSNKGRKERRKSKKRHHRWA